MGFSNYILPVIWLGTTNVPKGKNNTLSVDLSNIAGLSKNLKMQGKRSLRRYTKEENKTMNDYENTMRSLESRLAFMLDRDSAISEIKNNPVKYPEFDFWVPGYDAEEWAEKAIADYSKVMDGSLSDAPTVFKLIVMRHYRKLSQKWRKAGKGNLINSTEFAEELAHVVKELHPEFFKGKEV